MTRPPLRRTSARFLPSTRRLRGVRRHGACPARGELSLPQPHHLLPRAQARRNPWRPVLEAHHAGWSPPPSPRASRPLRRGVRVVERFVRAARRLCEDALRGSAHAAAEVHRAPDRFPRRPHAPRIAVKKSLTLEAARLMRRPAEATAAKNGWKVVIAVADDGGHGSSSIESTAPSTRAVATPWARRARGGLQAAHPDPGGNDQQGPYSFSPPA